MDSHGCWILFCGKTGELRCPIPKEVYDGIQAFRKDEGDADLIFGRHY